MPLQTFTVIYRTGGKSRCVWKRCVAVETREAADSQADYCEQMGYKTIVHKTLALDVIGIPTEWEA